MSKFDYPKMKLTADKLIDRFGQNVTIVKTSSSGDAWNPNNTETNYSATAAVVDYTDREIDGTLIEKTDKKAFIAAGDSGLIPKVGDKIIIGSEISRLINVKITSPAGVIVVFEAQVRK